MLCTVCKSRSELYSFAQITSSMKMCKMDMVWKFCQNPEFGQFLRFDHYRRLQSYFNMIGQILANVLFPDNSEFEAM